MRRTSRSSASIDRRCPQARKSCSEAYHPNRAEIVLDSPTAFRATYLTFRFSGLARSDR